MKKITSVLVTALLLTGLSAFPAKADGEATYAVVDSTGTVTNIIVCTAAVCGPGGSWGGRMPSDTGCPGCSLVLQISANPITGQNQGGHIGTQDNPVKYNSQEQVFTQGSASMPAPVTITETVETATLTATINSESITFGPDSMVNGQLKFTPKVTPSTSATLSAVEGAMKELAFFSTPQTRSQIQASIQNKLTLVQRYLNRFYELLKGWVLD